MLNKIVDYVEKLNQQLTRFAESMSESSRILAAYKAPSMDEKLERIERPAKVMPTPKSESDVDADDLATIVAENSNDNKESEIVAQLDVTDISSTILILVCKFDEIPWRNTSKHVIAKAGVTVRLKSFCEARQLDEAVLFVNHAFESNIMPSTWMCNHLVNLPGKGKKYESAFSIKRKMDLAGIVPRSRTFDVMVECYVHVNRPHLGLGVAGLITKHGFVVKMCVVTLIIKTLLQNGEIGKATELFQLAGRNGLVVDVVSYNTIINGLRKAKKIEEALNLFIEMESNNCSPNLFTHSILMDGLCKSVKVEEAMMLLNKKKETGPKPDSYPYSTIITCFYRLQNTDRAILVLEDMLDKGLTPNAVVYNSIIHSLSKAGQRKITTAMFNAMLEHGIQADSILYSSLIDGPCKNGRVKSALDMFSLMVEKGREPTLLTYNSLIEDAYVEVESSIIPEQCLLRWKFLLMGGDLNCKEHLIVGQTRVGSYFAHLVVEKIIGTTKYNDEDSYFYVNLHPVDYQAVWNSIKFAQWMLQVSGAISFMGSIGKDKYGKEMEKNAKIAGVNVLYYKDDNAPTGTCAVCIIGGDRSLVANLSAANCYKVEHLKHAENWALVEKAKYYYIAGFFLTISPKSIQLVAQHAAANNKVFSMNLSALFICEFFRDVQEKALPYMGFVFGNETEARMFSKVHGWKADDVEEIAIKISQWPKPSGTYKRITVITQGADPVVVVGMNDMREEPVEFSHTSGSASQEKILVQV
ncbi:hypothetical protein QQ045_005702 [Rhodiola kirilowii]